jgi:hypothetical protein
MKVVALRRNTTIAEADKDIVVSAAGNCLFAASSSRSGYRAADTAAHSCVDDIDC